MKGESRQSWDAFSYASCARFVSELGMPVVELLAPKAGERILDVGCGDGFLAQRMQLAGCEVVGIDTSRELVAAARARGVDARIMNAEAMTFGPEFDAVFSNAALHWMRRQDRVIDGAWRAVKSGGRFVVECGGKGNIDGILNGLKKAFARRGLEPDVVPSPWHFADVPEMRQRLEARGFVVQEIALFGRPTPLPAGVEGWLSVFAHDFLASFDAENRKDFLDDVTEYCRPALMKPDGSWVADYVRLRFSAIKPVTADD